MAHRKYEAPRHGSLGFLPKKRCKKNICKIRSFPKDNCNNECHLTAGMGYKAGMTHVVRETHTSGNKSIFKDVVESVSIIETPPLKILGIVGYIRTPRGLKSFKTIWTSDINDNFKRKLYKNWYKSKKKAFSRFESMSQETYKKDFFYKLGKIEKYCSTIRCIIATQIQLTGIKQKKSNVLEVQINGGNLEDKINFCKNIIGKLVPFSEIFSEGENVDLIGVTKGKGFQGVISRWGVTKLPRKTHRGARKVACVGSWHPSRVSFTVARAGQFGFHHRTHKNSIIYKIMKSNNLSNAATPFDQTEKTINPMGGFPHYGLVKTDSIIVKGNTLGSKKRVITLRKIFTNSPSSKLSQPIVLKFIDTSSKLGHGKYQTSVEKKSALQVGNI